MAPNNNKKNDNMMGGPSGDEHRVSGASASSKRNIFRRVVKNIQSKSRLATEEESCVMEVSMIRRDSQTEGILALMEQERQEKQQQGNRLNQTISSLWESFHNRDAYDSFLQESVVRRSTSSASLLTASGTSLSRDESMDDRNDSHHLHGLTYCTW
mmetsp:Transcript_17902/g.41425  ORF Transcript_17902/g.41425 Transcript_17902/m.41425 type:complete len:156 (-) Transcript_17902:73-540(-)